MGDTYYGNAMTEVALALSMAFFSIMILAIISMSTAEKIMAKEKVQSVSPVTAKLISTKPAGSISKTIKPATKDTLVIYHNGQYFDHQLKPLNPSAIGTSGRIILAFAPNTPMSGAMATGTFIKGKDLVVSILTEKWVAALKRLEKTEN